MMNETELMRLAAKAAGATESYDDGGAYFIRPGGLPFEQWNPLESNDDAFRLAVKLRLDIVQFSSTVRVNAPVGDDCHEAHDADPYAATRRAIVRAAASIESNTPLNRLTSP